MERKQPASVSVKNLCISLKQFFDSRPSPCRNDLCLRANCCVCKGGWETHRKLALEMGGGAYREFMPKQYYNRVLVAQCGLGPSRMGKVANLNPLKYRDKVLSYTLNPTTLMLPWQGQQLAM